MRKDECRGCEYLVHRQAEVIAYGKLKKVKVLNCIFLKQPTKIHNIFRCPQKDKI